MTDAGYEPMKKEPGEAFEPFGLPDPPGRALGGVPLRRRLVGRASCRVVAGKKWRVTCCAGFSPPVSFRHRGGGRQSLIGKNSDGSVLEYGATENPALACSEERGF